MNWLLALLGYFWIILGVLTVISTKTVRRYYGIFIEENHPKSMGALAVLVGGLLISSITSCRYIVLVLLLGIIQIIKGIFLLFAPHKYVQGIIDWWLNTSLAVYRIWGVLTATMGFILLKARL